MSSSHVMDRTTLEQCPDMSVTANQSFTADEKSALANSSFEHSPSLDREKFLRYSARSRDEFWDALSSNYDYLMDDGLIATCREASSDLSLDDEREIPEACFWSFTQFIEQFKWLHDLLHNIQVAKEGGSASSGSKIFEDQHKVAYLCKLFNDQAQRLSKKYPDMRDEVHRHLNRLNNKWKAVEQSINPNKVKSPSKASLFHEISLRMRNLRKWLRDLESRLIPINPTANWGFENLEKTCKEREELQKEIEVKGKCISSLLKLCDHLKGNVQFGHNSSKQWDSEQVRKVARNLESKWHSLWLESLQDQCLLEDLMDSYATNGDLEKSFTEEPLKKYPRLSSNCKELLLLENELKEKTDYKMEDEFIDMFDDQMPTDLTSHRDEYTLKNDKGVMVGDTGIAELKAECQNGNGKFEIIQDVGYSSETSAHLSNDEKLDSPEAHLVKNVDHKTFLLTSSVTSKVSNNNQVDSLCVTPSKVYLPPDKYPTIRLKTLHMLADDKQYFNSKYGSCKSVPDSFYKVTSVDEEVLDSVNLSEKENVPSELSVTENIVSKETDKSKLKEVSNKMSYLNLKCHPDSLSIEQNELDKKGFLIKNCFPSESHQSSHSVAKRNKKGVKSSVSKTAQPNELWKKSARVQEWLNTCKSVDDGTSDDNLDGPEKPAKTDWMKKTADSSCDASGEYTTESDSEKSNMSDVNNSITMSQSFTGSIETVIPVVPEENGIVHSDRAGSIDPSTGVRMRKKKRISRERPWSVTDVRQTLISSVVPHSTSESALDLLCSHQDSKKFGSKKISADSKRLSLTDVSANSCPSIKSFRINQTNCKTSSPKLNISSEKPPSRRKKVSISEKGSDKYDLASCSIAPKENSSVDKSDHSKLKAANAVDKNGKISLTECSSLETSLVSENEKNETVINVEDQGSSSDVAWDEYQDPPYLSEPYSEQTVDEDEVKKLINFGDDYRAMLGSYSDASSVSLKAPPFKAHKSKSKSSCRKGSSQESRDSLISDSNSDSEDLHNVLKTSNHALQFVSNSVQDNRQKMTAFSSEFADLFATCQTNLCHLHAIHEEISSGRELDSLSKEDILKLKELIKDWEVLRIKLQNLSLIDNEHRPKKADLEAATIDVHRSLAALEEKLGSISLTIKNAGDPALSLNHLQNNIKVLQAAFTNLQETKESVLSVSARILRLIDEGGPSITPLRENGTKLYQQWEDIYELNCSQLTKLQALQSRWHEPTENEMNSSSETTVQWQPVQVGDNLPTLQVSTEEPFQNTAAEVQVADQHDVLFEIETESAKASVQCIMDDEDEDFSDPVRLLSPPVLNTKRNLGNEKMSKDVEAGSANTKKPSCFWRTLRATVPIQFALVVLYCMSSLMEPNCCDNMNNYDFSLSPHLRYFRGPPPV